MFPWTLRSPTIRRPAIGGAFFRAENAATKNPKIRISPSTRLLRTIDELGAWRSLLVEFPRAIDQVALLGQHVAEGAIDQFLWSPRRRRSAVRSRPAPADETETFSNPVHGDGPVGRDGVAV